MARVSFAVLVVALAFFGAVECGLPTKTPTKGPTATKAPTQVPAPTPRPRVCTDKCMATGGVGMGPALCPQVWPKPVTGFKPCAASKNESALYPDECGFYRTALGDSPDRMNCYPIYLTGMPGAKFPKWCTDKLGFYPLANGTYPSCPK